MKPKSILINTLGIILVCFAFACGSDRSSSENNADKESKSEESAAVDEDVSMNKKEVTETPQYAATEEAESAPSDNDAKDALFKNQNNQGGLDRVFSSSAAKVDENDTIHKFIRTGDIRFKVKSVADATYKIEDITRRFKGFVTYTTLNSRIDRQTERVISPDSILKTTYFTVENTITIRVPSKNLDTALKQISQLVEYLDYRNISANDVRLQILSNQLEKRRLARYNERLSNISDKGNSNYMEDKAYIEENLLQKQAQADQSLINDLSLEDQIEYSTITLSLYQGQELNHELIANEENIEEFKPSLGSRMGDSLMTGWYFIEDLVVGLIAAWPLFLILIVIYLILRKNGYLKRRRQEEK